MTGWIGRASQQVLDAIYPPRCIACPSWTETPAGLCSKCWSETTFFSGDVCSFCGVPVATGGGEEQLVCEGCHKNQPCWDAGRSAVAYDGTGRRLVLALKHSDRLDTAPVLAQWMVQAARPLIDPDTLIIPVPLHWRRLLARKFNQASELSKHMARETGASVLPDALWRVTATPSLKGMTRKDRQSTLFNAIAPNDDRLDEFKGRPVLLVDDVLTTGSTLSAAATVCREAGATKVNIAVLARVARPE